MFSDRKDNHGFCVKSRYVDSVNKILIVFSLIFGLVYYKVLAEDPICGMFVEEKLGSIRYTR